MAHGVGLVLLGLGMALGPVLVGSGVATTFASELVPWSGQESTTGMLTAVLVSMVVVLALTRLGIPTGLTLALVGAIAGFGAASGAQLDWHTIAVVLAMMAAAPLIGGLVASLIVGTLARRIRARHVGRALGRMHVLAFSLLALGYGASDGQKMLAISAIALGAATAPVAPSAAQLGAVAGLFVLGSAIGYRRMASRLGRGVLSVRPLYAVSAEASTSAALLTSTAIGAPVGVAQTLTGSLVGAGMAQGVRRVRWIEVGKIVVAWAVTLPLAFGGAAAVAALRGPG